MNEQEKISAAADLRMADLNSLEDALQQAKGLFREHTNTESIEELEDLRKTYQKAIRNAHSLRTGPKLGVRDKVEQLLKLEDRLSEAESRFENYVSSLYLSVGRAAKDPNESELSAAQHLIEEQRDILVAAGRDQEYKELQQLLEWGQRSVRERTTHIKEDEHLANRIGKLDKELPGLKDDYDILVGTVTKKGANQEAKDFHTTILTKANLANQLHEEARKQGLEGLVEKGKALEENYEHFERQAANLYSHAHTHWKSKIAKNLAKVAAYTVFGVASIKLSIYGYQALDKWLEKEPVQPTQTIEAPAEAGNQPPAPKPLPAPEPAPAVQPDVPQWAKTVGYVSQRFAKDRILYVNRQKLEAMMITVDDPKHLRVHYVIPYTGGRIPGDKQEPGDNRTDEGVFGIDRVGIAEPGYMFTRAIGSAYVNLQDEDLLTGKGFEGQGIAGAGTKFYHDVVGMKDVTKGGIVFTNDNARMVAADLQQGGLVIVEDPRSPLAQR